MNRNNKTIGLGLVLVASCTLAKFIPDAPSAAASDQASAVSRPATSKNDPLPTAVEARGRARLLHETVRAMLQVIHHEYYREDEKLPIPARTFKKVFQELATQHKVELRWLAVTGQAMNVSHNPQNDFEKKAAEALASGKDDYEVAENGIFRRVGTIALTAECLKCHVPNRTSLENRVSGLVITMPIESK